MIWRLISQAEAAVHWDRWLHALGDTGSFHQSFPWGQVKERLGWEVLRFALGDTPEALAQVLVRRYRLGVSLAWIPGGPVGDLSKFDQGFLDSLRQFVDTPVCYCRANALRLSSAEAVEQMLRAGWRKPAVPLNTGQSMMYDLAMPEDARLALATGNWRHNLKRAGKYGLQLTPWECRDASEIMAIYRGMEQHKNLVQQLTVTEVQAILDLLGDRLLLYRCDDAHGVPLALRGCAMLGDRAWDLFAAATPAARKIYASYASFWALIQGCAERKIRHYDMGGIDPVANRGVYDFKKGCGARPIEYLGEWEWCSTQWLAGPINWMIKRRSGRL